MPVTDTNNDFYDKTSAIESAINTTVALLPSVKGYAAAERLSSHLDRLLDLQIRILTSRSIELQ